MWRYHCVLLFWSYAVVSTESTVWINYFCTWCARFAYAQLWWAISYFSMYIINTSSHDFSYAIWNKQALVNFSKIKNLSVFKKIYSCLFIANALEIMWLPIQIAHYSVQLPELKCLLDKFPFLWVGLHFSSMMFKNARIT